MITRAKRALLSYNWPVADEHVSRREWTFFLGGVLLLVLAVYAFSLQNGFVFWDDPDLVIDNPASHGVTIPNITTAFTTYDPDLYVPLTIISFQLNYAISGLQPFLYHLTNILLHAGSAMLVGWVFFRISGKKSVALLTAFLFAVHPINVEAAAWVSARKDVLSSFFFLLSLGSFLEWRGGRSSRWYVISLVAFLCGLLSKVSILSLPLILLLCDWLNHGRSGGHSSAMPLRMRSMIVDKIPFVILSIAFGIVSLFGKMGGTFSLFQKHLVGMKAALFSLWHLAAPVNYSVVYPFTGVPSITRPDLLVPLVIIISVIVVTFLYRKKFPAFFFSWWWFLLLIAPSFLTAEKGQDVVHVLYLTSDRYVYLAAISIFFLFAFHVQKAPRLAYPSGMLVVILAALSTMQSLVWKDTETLLHHALATTPDSAIVHNNLGAYYDSIGEPERAAAEYAAASTSDGGTADSWFNVGIAALREKRRDDAIVAFTRAVELRPSFFFAHLNLGALLTDTGRIEEAVDHLLAAQKLDPGNLTVYLNLGIALEKGGNTIDARRAYERALVIDPENAYAKERLAELK